MNNKQRYKVVYIYGRYEIHDTLLEAVLCYTYSSEYVNEICRSMNSVWEQDKIMKQGAKKG